MKKRILFLVAALALLLSACGGSPSSAMAEELSAKYDFYEKSAENIKKGFDVSADDADQVFLALVDCGISSEMGYITKNADGSFKVYASGTDYTVSMDGNTVSSVFLGEDQLYPEFIPHNDLMDYELTVKDVMNGSGDTVIGQRAYIRLGKDQLEEMTADHLREFAENRVEGSGYNWVSIIVTGGNGICFPGSDTSFAEYGKLDEDGSLLESVGTWMRQSDGSYTYSEN